MKMFFWGIFSFVLLLIGFLAWAAWPWSVNEIITNPEIQTVQTEYQAEFPDHPSVIKILTFNIGFLYGEGSEGTGYELRDEAYYEKSLDKFSSEIKAWDADIVCLQEVDLGASRSHNINQALYVAKKAGYPYVAEAATWLSNYIPFPYWPIKNNFGKMRSGGAILSRYPLIGHEVISLAKPMSQPWWYNLFYLHRYFQKVTVDIDGNKFKLINLHLEAFDKEDRKSQIEKLVSIIGQDKTDLITGDFNILPASATKRSGFDNGDEYRNDSGYNVMLKSGLSEVIPDEIYAKDEAKFFTFPSWKPDRRLDYIWYQPSLKMMMAEVLSSSSSDHLPLKATFQIGGPHFSPFQ
jgi:endonuclease/exonuclease/phosphatase family metal-dependent hydrolase